MSGSAKAKKKKGSASKSSGAKAKDAKKKQKAEQKKVVARDTLNEERLRKVAEEMEQGQPLWYRVIMFSFLAVGLLWIVVYYIFEGLYPIAGIGMWNITIGIGALMVSMLMMTRWR